MIDPVKLAERHKDAIGVCERLAENNHGETILAVISETADFHRDTATALRLLSAYAEAAAKEVGIRQRASGFSIDNPHKPPQYCLSTPVGLADAKSRTDAARAALESAGIKIGGAS